MRIANVIRSFLLLFLVVLAVASWTPSPAAPSGNSQGLAQRVADLEARVAALEAGDNGGGNLATDIIGTWSGSRFNQTDPWSGDLVESTVSFTFNADGTFTAADFSIGGGEYKVVGSSVIAGPASLHDVRIQGDTLTFGTSNGYVGASIYGSIGAVYLLTRQP